MEPTLKPISESSNASSVDASLSFEGFEGYLTLEFSLYAPNSDYATLESFFSEIITNLLCSGSRNLWLISSIADMINECPYQRMLLMSPSSILRYLLVPEEDTTILWNTPRITSRLQTLEDIQYYAWNFSYPVVQWGEEEESDLQASLDQSIVSNRLDRVIPSNWDGARVSVSGQEQSTFLFLNDDNAPPFSQSGAEKLRYVGIAMIALDMLFLIVISHLANRRKRNKATETPLGVLVCHEGVDKMLQTTRRLVSNESRLVHDTHHTSEMVYFGGNNGTNFHDAHPTSQMVHFGGNNVPNLLARNDDDDDDDDESIELSIDEYEANMSAGSLLSSLLK